MCRNRASVARPGGVDFGAGATRGGGTHSSFFMVSMASSQGLIASWLAVGLCASPVHAQQAPSSSGSDRAVPAVSAEPDDSPTLGARTAPRSAYEQGLELIAAKQYTEARAAFVRALQATVPPVEAHYALGQTELALGRPCAAVESYKNYLQAGAQMVTRETQQRIRRHIEQLEASTASAETCAEGGARASLYLTCNVPGAAAAIDGTAVEVTARAPSLLAPGRHVVQFHAGTRHWTPFSIELVAGRATYVQCAEPAPDHTVPQEPLQRPGRQRRAFTPGQKAGLGITGTGVAAGLAAASVHLWNWGRYHAWSRSKEYQQARDPGYARSAEFVRTAASIETVERVNLGLSIAAGVLTTVGVTILVLETNKAKKRRARAAPHAESAPELRRAFERTASQQVSARWGNSATQLTWSGTW